MSEKEQFKSLFKSRIFKLSVDDMHTSEFADVLSEAITMYANNSAATYATSGVEHEKIVDKLFKDTVRFISGK